MTPLGVAAFIALFIVAWLTAGFLVSAIGGWWELGERYRTYEAPPSHVKRWQSGKMGRMTRYNNALTVGADARGLYLAMPSLFRVGHPPLHIPWHDIATEPTTSLFGRRIRFTFTRTPNVFLELREPLAHALLTVAR
jgi:hypothetical protein